VTATTERSWHVGEYHPLAWAETAVKAVAFVVAYVAFVHALDRSLHSPSGIRIVELVLLGLAEVGILLAVVDRVIERELIAVGFVLFNNAAHASMLYALLAVPGPGGLLSIFCAFMLGGELIKWRWLHEERPPMRQLSLMAAQAFVVAYAAIYLVALVFTCVLGLGVKNIVRGHVGRQWMAIRDMDIAAEIIGVRPMYAKLTAFAVSSFMIGVAGALWAFVYLGSWEPAAFSIDRSFQLMFMVIIGGLGSILGSVLGAAFIVLLPIFLNQALPPLGAVVGWKISTATVSHFESMIFGALIVFFLIVEPHGLARLWSVAKEKLRLWPFPH